MSQGGVPWATGLGYQVRGLGGRLVCCGGWDPLRGEGLAPLLLNIGGIPVPEHQACSLRQDSELGTPRLATKSDVSWLAGMLAWASTACMKGLLRELLAAACFFGYRSGMVRLVRAGQVWHADLELLLPVVPVGRPARSSGAVLWGCLWRFGARQRVKWSLSDILDDCIRGSCRDLGDLAASRAHAASFPSVEDHAPGQRGCEGMERLPDRAVFQRCMAYEAQRC